MPGFDLVITTEADQDLNNLYVDGFKRFGEAQADRYYDAILSHLDVLCDNPYLFRAVDEIRAGYRRSVCGKHPIYYRVIDSNVEIVGLVKHENRYL